MRPVSAVLARSTDRNCIIERLADGDTTYLSIKQKQVHQHQYPYQHCFIQSRAQCRKYQEEREVGVEVAGGDGVKYEPLRNHNSAVHPRRRIEEHAMVMYRSRLVERVESVHEEVVGRVDFDHRRSIPFQSISACTNRQVDERRRRDDNIRPSAINTNNTPRIQTIRVRVLDIGDIPPYLLRARNNGRDNGSEKDGERRK